MPINTKQLIELIIQPTLKDLGLYSLAAEQLLVGTCAQESGIGTYLQQVPSGIAKGLWMMEDATHNDLWDNFLHYNTSLYKNILGILFIEPHEIFSLTPPPSALVYNLKYACAMARIHYFRVKEPLPAANYIPALAAYWKQHYNTPLGAGTEQEFIDNFNRYVLPYYEEK